MVKIKGIIAEKECPHCNKKTRAIKKIGFICDDIIYYKDLYCSICGEDISDNKYLEKLKKDGKHINTIFF